MLAVWIKDNKTTKWAKKNEEELSLEINITETVNSGWTEENYNINYRHQDISCARKWAFDRLEKLAKKMKTISDKNHEAVITGDNVTIPIYDVDKAKRDLINVIGVVWECKYDLYKIGSRHGVINRLYCSE